jgi:hypothetical protein
MDLKKTITRAETELESLIGRPFTKEESVKVNSILEAVWDEGVDSVDLRDYRDDP